MKVKELTERKQEPHETFSDYVSDMHNLHFKLQLAEEEFVGLLKNIMNSHMGEFNIPYNVISGAQKRGSPS